MSDRLNFSIFEKWYRMTECRRYVIAKVVVNDEVRFEASIKAAKGWQFLKQNLTDYKVAKGICQAHADAAGQWLTV